MPEKLDAVCAREFAAPAPVFGLDGLGPGWWQAVRGHKVVPAVVVGVVGITP